MLLAIHRRLYRWYHEWRVRRVQAEVRHIERVLETNNLDDNEMFAVECWLDQTVCELRYHQAKLAALFPQPTTER
jgi:hypothetical protein